MSTTPPPPTKTAIPQSTSTTTVIIPAGPYKSLKSRVSLISLESIVSFPSYNSSFPDRVSLVSDFQDRIHQGEISIMEELCEDGHGWGDGHVVREEEKGIEGEQGKGNDKEVNQFTSPLLHHPQEKSLQKKVPSTEASCRCQKSKCLLLYCQCFSKGLTCNDRCECNKCRNTSQLQQERQIARRSVLQRDPNAFANKLQVVGSEEAKIGHKRGCRCKKTHCLKKYCECFQAGVHCTYLCNCEGCFNGQQEPIYP